jgi:hypothetical protein
LGLGLGLGFEDRFRVRVRVRISARVRVRGTKREEREREREREREGFTRSKNDRPLHPLPSLDPIVVKHKWSKKRGSRKPTKRSPSEELPFCLFAPQEKRERNHGRNVDETRRDDCEDVGICGLCRRDL